MEHLKADIEKYLAEYVGTITHTNTPFERNTLDFFKKYFEEIEYFKNNPGNCGFYDIPEDHLQRKIPWALLKGQGGDTVVLIHHTDTVDTDDYGTFQKLAYSPFELTSKYKDGDIHIDESTRADLEGGKWLFGRGVADMKGGAAIHLALLKAYSKNKKFKGNLLLLGLPDEENLSAGMRSAIFLLKELKEQHGLNYKLTLNVEPHERDNQDVATIYDGSIGKLMPVLYVRGKLAHVGQVFRGFNPINLMSEIVRRTELNTDFLEKVGNTATPPPTWLYMKDRKEVYDVSLPLAAAGYMSILTLDKPPKEIFEKLEQICTEAFEQVICDMNKSYEVYTKLSGLEFQSLGWKPNVKSYEKLYGDALRDSGEKFTSELNDLMAQIKVQIHSNQLSMADGAYKVIEKTLEHVNDLSPVVIIALAPPYYPNVNNRMLPEKFRQMDALIDYVRNYSLDVLNQPLAVQNYYTGISDLSYSLFASDEENISYLQSNMLLWGDLYYIPLETMKELSMPVLNIGPWGKDFHKYTERVFMDDLFYNTPKLIDIAIKKILLEF